MPVGSKRISCPNRNGLLNSGKRLPPNLPGIRTRHQICFQMFKPKCRRRRRRLNIGIIYGVSRHPVTTPFCLRTQLISLSLAHRPTFPSLVRLRRCPPLAFPLSRRPRARTLSLPPLALRLSHAHPPLMIFRSQMHLSQLLRSRSRHPNGVGGDLANRHFSPPFLRHTPLPHPP